MSGTQNGFAMLWNSASDFFAMGGYGFYVWGSFGVSALALVAEVWLVRRRHAAARPRGSRSPRCCAGPIVR